MAGVESAVEHVGTREDGSAEKPGLPPGITEPAHSDVALFKSLPFSTSVAKFHELDLPHQLFLIASLCYVSGFIITNLYFVGHGVTSIELVRFRYVSAGLLFLAFISAVVIPLRGLWGLLEKYVSDFMLPAVVRVAAYSLGVYIPLYLGAVILYDATGTVTPSRPAVPKLFNVMESTDALSGLVRVFEGTDDLSRLFTLPNTMGVESTVAFTAVLFVLPPIMLCLAILYYGLHIQIRRSLSDEPRVLVRHKRQRIVLVLLRISILCWLFGSSLVAISAMVVLGGDFLAGEGWQRLVLMSALLYTMLLLCVGVVRTTTSELVPLLKLSMPHPNFRMSVPKTSPLHIWRAVRVPAVLIALVVNCVLTYLVAVYPHLPQQLGGGSVLPVQLVLDPERNSQMLGPGMDTFLVDRSDSESVFELRDDKGKTVGFIQVSNSDIKGLLYIPSESAR
jgi:hypothetical protein